MSGKESRRMGRAAERARRRSRASLKVVLPTAVALGAGAAVAIGQIPGADGTITACYQDVPQGTNGADGPFGSVRIIDPSAASDGDPTWPNNACGPNEHIITWNQEGPPGSTGQAGSQGPMGPMGPKGAAGTVVGSTSFSIKASKTDRLLMKLDGVTGGVTEKAFKGDIELSSLAVGAETAVGAVGGAGAGAGKVNVQSFSFAKKRDRSDVALMGHVVDGRAIKLAEIGVYHVSKGSKLVEVADYKLTDVLLTSEQQNASSEVITGTFQKLNASVGTGTNKVSTGWNLQANKTS